MELATYCPGQPLTWQPSPELATQVNNFIRGIVEAFRPLVNWFNNVVEVIKSIDWATIGKPRIPPKPVRRHKRQIAVLAKRKALDLDLQGKCCFLRTRKASKALRMAENAWSTYGGVRPRPAQFERVSPCQQRKKDKQDRRWRALRLSNEQLIQPKVTMRENGLKQSVFNAEIDWEETYRHGAAKIANAFAISPQMLGTLENGNR